MTKWAVSYTRIPTNYNTTRVAIVEAETRIDAINAVMEQTGDRTLEKAGECTVYYYTAKEYVEPEPVKAKIISMG